MSFHFCDLIKLGTAGVMTDEGVFLFMHAFS